MSWPKKRIRSTICLSESVTPPMISFLSSSLCDDVTPYPAFPGQLFSRTERGQYANPDSNTPDVLASPLLAAPRRQAESASDDLLSVLVLHGPDTQYCVRPEALESIPGERFHLWNGSSRNPGLLRHAHTSSGIDDLGWIWFFLFQLVTV